MAKIKRRYFLAGGALSAAALASWQWKRASAEEAIVTILRLRLDYLKLDESGVKQFARDAMAKNLISQTKLRVSAMTGLAYDPLSKATARMSLGKALRHGEERVTTMFLLSSDFFQNGKDENSIVKYLGYYNPSLACGSPFARPPVV